MATNGRIEPLKEELDVESWGGPETGQPNVFFLNFFLTGHEIPEWELDHKRSPVEEEGVTSNLTFWKPISGEKDDARLRVDTVECPSQEVAHEQVLAFLGEVQGPTLERVDEGPGEVAFAPEERATTLVMALGNLVTRFLNAGRDIVEVRDPADQLGHTLSAPPEPAREKAPGPQFEELRLEKWDGARLLALEAEDPIQEEEVGFRIFSSGEIQRTDGQLRYQPPAQDADQLRVYAITRLGGVSEKTIDVKPE